MTDGAVTAVFEGNEGQSVIDSVQKLIGLALSAPENGAAYKSEAVEAYLLSALSGGLLDAKAKKLLQARLL